MFLNSLYFSISSLPPTIIFLLKLQNIQNKMSSSVGVRQVEIFGFAIKGGGGGE